MDDFLATAFPWLRALHVISVIAWMAGLLYLPRLFVYHCDAPPGSDKSETFKIMERRLLKAIMTPAMIASWLLGILLIVATGALSSGEIWIYAKLVLVVGLSALHDMIARWQRAFARDANTHSPRFFRIMNEVPALFMILIVIFVVVKPF